MTVPERRRYLRYQPKGLEGSLVFSIEAEVTNISLSGMAVEARTPFTVGQSYSICLGSEESSLQLTALAKWCQLDHVRQAPHGRQETRYQSGFSFEDVMVGQTEAVCRFLESKVVVDVEERLTGRLDTPGAKIHIVSETVFKIHKLSLGGMLIEAEAHSLVDSEGRVELRLNEEPLQVRIRVATSGELTVLDRRIQHLMGVEFLDLTPRDQEILESFIRTELEDDPIEP